MDKLTEMCLKTDPVDGDDLEPEAEEENYSEENAIVNEVDVVEGRPISLYVPGR